MQNALGTLHFAFDDSRNHAVCTDKHGMNIAEFVRMSENTQEIELLKAAVQQLYNCEATHFESVPVEEPYEGKATWKGDVAIFIIKGHPRSRRCFAWFSRENSAGLRPMAFLERWPTSSPQLAVRAAIALELFAPGGQKNPPAARTQPDDSRPG